MTMNDTTPDGVQYRNLSFNSEQKYRLLIENSNDAIIILQDGMVKFHNPQACLLIGYTDDEIRSIPFISHVHPDDQDMVINRHLRRLAGENFDPNVYALRVIDKNGNILWGEVNAVYMEWDNRPSVMCFIRNITKQKRAEDALLRAHRELEERVEQRTRELADSNDALALKTLKLAEMNTAMKVLLEGREKDKNQISEDIIANVKELLIPYLEKLAETAVNDLQTAYIDIIRSNLDNIISPFTKTLTASLSTLTSTEIKVADLVRHGKRTKEIADILNISIKTVSFHRENIRRKLDIKNRKINLRTYLLSL